MNITAFHHSPYFEFRNKEHKQEIKIKINMLILQIFSYLNLNFLLNKMKRNINKDLSFSEILPTPPNFKFLF
ncbi:hypothetical protein BpHYR1_051523 [Brachionus plicatilis]|uniref:Uncharacterized protein n=1 Tax=Brachionus plicatilis TaxID=10195 RepID=A0A3M7R8P8_BRAPC|nr:hypothetical protein BpHYR1_051523 [Brachionus plicatilis]